MRFLGLGLIFFFVVSVAARKIINHDFPELGEYCVISSDIFWRSERLMNPSQYYYCVNRRVVVGTCPEGMGFLQTGDSGCTFFATWECLGPSIFHFSCENSTDGSIVPIANPNEYAYCFHGIPFSYHNCPEGLGFVDEPDFLGCCTWDKWNKYTECF